MKKQDLPYLNYWLRKKLSEERIPSSKTYYWVDAPGSPSEEIIDSIVFKSKSILDFGAGDLKVKKRLELKGFAGSYFSYDQGNEFPYTYSTQEEINSKFDTILFMDVIEHLNLEDGLELTLNLLEKLNSKGRLIIQTPNGKCIRNHLGSDFTHKQLYNINDLYTYFKALNYNVTAYRVCFQSKVQSFSNSIVDFLGRLIATKFLGVDYADNILLIVEKID